MAMKLNCPYLNCVSSLASSPKNPLIVLKGYYFRKSDSRWIKRFYCKSCEIYFSAAAFKSTYHQKKRRINAPLKKLLCSGVSQRRAAMILKVNRKTIVRRFRFLANESRQEHGLWMEKYKKLPLLHVQFDDLETSEHTKCKPLSVALAIDPNSRKILNFQVNQMPAKGLLAKKALKKYGYRPDQRSSGWDEMMRSLQPYVEKKATFTSDENPHYPSHLFRHFKDAIHIQVKGGRGAITGQGELKKLKHDPLFSLNHTCAMLRANLNRLFRKTWCTTKTKQGLIDHLFLYVCFHNRILTPQGAGLGAS